MKKLEIVYINKKDLALLENNPRKIIDKDGVKKLKNLIKKHGFQNPLQVYKEKTGINTIICGNHRFKAGLDLKMEEFPCIVYEENRKKALARAISDNISNTWTEFDIPGLKDIFSDLDDGNFDMSLTGFDDDEIKEMFDFESKDIKEEDYTEKYEVIIECKDESDQEIIYNMMKKKGYKCRILTL